MTHVGLGVLNDLQRWRCRSFLGKVFQNNVKGHRTVRQQRCLLFLCSPSYVVRTCNYQGRWGLKNTSSVFQNESETLIAVGHRTFVVSWVCCPKPVHTTAIHGCVMSRHQSCSVHANEKEIDCDKACRVSERAKNLILGVTVCGRRTFLSVAKVQTRQSLILSLICLRQHPP